ncbi:hypothetical protein EDD30_0070 [Couchioplanes caeruleus]|uniref:Uncharacterized protein n=2 Tax=Couchioplanes caeruleus TaxID=56438 RepID=A0A1K0GQY1_9ACTN|nr:hypothetical protein BG844_24965 [Couchioplanes caeruleus subsp. caeruleus]ROP27401.1 hypothetical protein EDD30_0070 [Couchioplanes caeruleus]
MVAALLAGAAGLGLTAAGWWIAGWEPRADWGRLTDPSWWTGALVRAVAFLSFGKAGFKVALLVVLGAAAAITWLRTRRQKGGERPESDDDPTLAASGESATGPAGSG